MRLYIKKSNPFIYVCHFFVFFKMLEYFNKVNLFVYKQTNEIFKKEKYVIIFFLI